MPVGRLARLLKKGRYAERIGGGAPVFLAGVLEYLVTEILDLAAEVAKANKKVRIIPRHLMMAVQRDEELSPLLKNVVFAESGVMPYIHPVLLPKRTKQKEENDRQQESTEHIKASQDF